MDLAIIRFLNNLSGRWPFVDNAAVFFAESFGNLIILFLVLILVWDLFSKRDKYKMILQAFAAAVLSRLVFAEIIRFFWDRQRPFLSENFRALFEHDPTPAFPSGHAAFFFGLAAVIYYYNKKAGILMFIAGFIISAGRVFSGVHWPSDILGGLAVGIFSAWIIVLSLEKFFSIAKKQPRQQQ